jgi:predicted transcriptional regulator
MVKSSEIGKRLATQRCHFPSNKPNFQQVRQEAKTADGQIITRQMIADKAGLSYSEIYRLDIAGHLSGATVRRALRAFNELSGMKVKEQDIKRGE